MQPLPLSELDAFRDWYEAELDRLRSCFAIASASLAAEAYAYQKALEGRQALPLGYHHTRHPLKAIP